MRDYKVEFVRDRSNREALIRLLEDGWEILFATGVGHSDRCAGYVEYVLRKPPADTFVGGCL